MVIALNRVYYCFFVILTFCSCSKTQVALHEKYRPQIHFSPSEHRMSVPSGLVYVDGKYHLFYQCNIVGDGWLSNDWGHAVSDNLVNWEEMPVVTLSDSDYVTPGCVVVDLRNTSGLGSATRPPLVAVFIRRSYDLDGYEVRSMESAYSIDKGFSWTKNETRLAIPESDLANASDPQIIRHEKTGQWIMLISLGNKINFYSSSDLLEWRFESTFDIINEYEDVAVGRPDLFVFKPAGATEEKWFLTVNCYFGLYQEWLFGYFVGDFAGHTFTTTQTQPLWIDYGNDNCGSITFHNLPEERHIAVGWMNNWNYADAIPVVSSHGMLTFPRTLYPEKIENRWILTSRPIKELEELFGTQKVIRDLTLVQDIRSTGIMDITAKLGLPTQPSVIDICFDIEQRIGLSEKFGIRFSNENGEYLTVGYDFYHQQFYVDRTHSTAESLPESFTGVRYVGFSVGNSGKVDMKLLLDAASLELFGGGCKVAVTEIFYPSSQFNKVELFAENGRVHVDSLSAVQLNYKKNM